MIVAIYFSPTGSTKAIVEHVAEHLARRFSTTFRLQPYTLPTQRDQWQPIAPDDIVLWATPVYAGRIPNKTLDFVSQHIQAQGNKGIAIAVFGNRSYDNALAEMCQLMQQGGITPVAAAAVVSRHAFAPKEIGQCRPNVQDYSEIDTWADTIDLQRTQSVEVPGDPTQGYYQPLKADLTPALFLKAKPQVNDDRCMRCGRCQQFCPMGSISITSQGPQINGICIKCQSCIRRCPEDALSFADPDFLSHVAMLKEHHSAPAANEFFL